MSTAVGDAGGQWRQLLMGAAGSALAVYILFGAGPASHASQRLIAGIENEGTTCYISAALQALCALPRLQAFLGTLPLPTDSAAAHLLRLAQALRATRQGRRRTASGLQSCSARPLFRALFPKTHAPPPGHQDAHELLQLLLHRLEAELESLSAARRCRAAVGPGLGQIRALAGNPACSRARPPAPPPPPLQLPTVGLLASRLTCQACRYARPQRLSPFHNLSLHLPQGLPAVRLEACLALFTAGETVDGVECPLCAQIRALRDFLVQPGAVKGLLARADCQPAKALSASAEEDRLLLRHAALLAAMPVEAQTAFRAVLPPAVARALQGFASSPQARAAAAAPSPPPPPVRQPSTKQLSIARPPPVLCLHINRTGAGLVKNSARILFGPTLDLGPFLTAAGSARYRLRATIVHYGSAVEGHYVAYVRHDDDGGGDAAWMCASDSDVHAVDEATVLLAPPYMLFYERIEDEDAAGDAAAGSSRAAGAGGARVDMPAR